MNRPPLRPITDELVAEIRDRIVEAVGPEEIWIFGSAATGATGEFSDLDLLIVSALPEGCSRHELVVRIRSLFHGARVPLDVFVLEREEFEHWKETPGHLAYTVVSHGRRIHG